ncbi:biopolymer transporter ExbD [Flagellimonas marina]|uniref:Biopolymer transporter ExbD n=1 Tax=Flagellimonas marina TaxID=1775168 RepID=A0ABV8PMZ5_9FLAO
MRSQTDRIETQIMNCVYNEMKDKGLQYKKAIKNYESFLISENLLLDGSAQSYLTTIQKIASDRDFDYYPSKPFMDFVTLEEHEIKRTKCNNFPKSGKLALFHQAIDSITKSGYSEADAIAQVFLSVLSIDDFELDYYKLKTFALLIWIRTGEGMENEPVKELPKIYDSNSVIEIYLDAKGQPFVNENKISLEKLSGLIYKYMENKKAESAIIIKTDKSVSYKNYIQIQKAVADEILYLREKLSVEMYNIPFKNLSKEQKEELKNIYPMNVYEQ